MVDLTVEMSVLTAMYRQRPLFLVAWIGREQSKTEACALIIFPYSKGEVWKRRSFLDAWVSFRELPVPAVVLWPTWLLSSSTLHQQPMAQLERKHCLFRSEE